METEIAENPRKSRHTLKIFDMKYLGLVTLVLLVGFATFAFGTSSGTDSKTMPAKFYVVCASGSHQWNGGYCSGPFSDLESANQAVASHNESYNGHSASRCAGSCPGCN